MKKYTAETIAQWFVLRAKRDVNQGGELLTKLKLQKLLYYAQGFYYAFYGKKLFNDKIVHMPYGPAVQSILDLLKNADQPITDMREYTKETKESDLSDDVVAILDLVYEKFGQFSAYKLVQMTHEESPWQETKQGEEILVDKIGEYFKKHYITE